jgi:hypothetical protein
METIQWEKIMADGGFWIFIAALVVAGIWADSRKKSDQHETLRRIVEKTGTIDEAKLKAVFANEDGFETKPGYAYRGLRIFGTIVLFIGAGIAAFFLIAALLGKIFGLTHMFVDVTGLMIGLAVAVGVAVVGLGLFFSSRFATPPPASPNEPPGR